MGPYIHARTRAPRRPRAAARGVFDTEFQPGEAEALQRWLRDAVAPGVVIGAAVQLSMRGRLRLRGTWRNLTADQLIAPGRGYVWAARTAFGGLPYAGFDNYVDGVACGA
jgi:hypothetical protein